MAQIRSGRHVRVRTLLPGIVAVATVVLLHAVAPLSSPTTHLAGAGPAFSASDQSQSAQAGRDLAAAAGQAADGSATSTPATAAGPTLVPTPDPTAPAALAAPTPPPAAKGERFEAPPTDPVVLAEPSSPPPRPSSRAAASGRGVWAVVVGVDDYPGSNDLQSAVNDANDVDAALGLYQVPGTQRLLLRNGSARSGDILAAVDWLVANAGPEATAVFFYAGHVRQVSRGVEGIVASDGRVVTDATLASRLRNLAARQTWITIAGCFGGGFTEVLAPSRILVAAAPAGVYAYENEGFGRSYLVEYMVRRAMLAGYAPGSVQEAYAWAYNQLQRDYPNRMPVAYDQSGSPIRLGPSGPPNPAPPPPAQPGQPQPTSPPPPTTTPPTTTPPSCRGIVVIGHGCS